MNEWMYAWCKVLCKCDSETLNTQYFQQKSISIDSKKGYRRPILLLKHMTWTNDPKPDPKETSQVRLTDTDASIFLFFTFVIWPSHASSFPGVHLRFRLWPLCSLLSVVIYSFCSLSIRSRFRSTLEAPFSLPPRLAHMIILSTLQWSMKSLLWQWVPSPLAL